MREATLTFLLYTKIPRSQQFIQDKSEEDLFNVIIQKGFSCWMKLNYGNYMENEKKGFPLSSHVTRFNSFFT
jgi:hypothetical protein